MCGNFYVRDVYCVYNELFIILLLLSDHKYIMDAYAPGLYSILCGLWFFMKATCIVLSQFTRMRTGSFVRKGRPTRCGPAQ